MSFVTTRPEELEAAASKLQTIGNAMTAENAAAAAPTTGVVPAAADEVSALQATQFAAYGKLYQSVSAQAAEIHQMLVNTLGTNSGSYGETEAANQTATSSTSLSGLLGSLSGGPGATSAAAIPAAGSTAGTSGGAAVFAINGAQNFTSAASDLISQATIGTLPGFGGAAAGGSTAGVSGLAGMQAPVLSGASAGAGGFGAAPVLAGVGQASSVSGLSVPPAWASGASVPAVSSTPATLASAGWTNAAPHTAQVTTVPAGMPAVASAGKGVSGFGAPRYGIKPIVMPTPAVV
jgi:PE family/PPE-SVP subfamily C-terminal region